MKDSEFIELLNLYLDHEISPADAARLEAEVQAHPHRRKVYEQYCRMQKACRVLAEEFQPDSAPEADRKVVAFTPGAASRASGLYTLGAVAAAAACVAIVFLGRQREEAAARLAAPVASVATVSVPEVERARGPVSAGLVSAPLSLSGHAGAVLVSASVATDQPELEWVRQFQLAPMTAPVALETLRFEARPASLQPVPARSPAAPAPAAEMTAFRFQR